MNNKILKETIKKQCDCVKKYELHHNAIIYTSINNERFVVKQNKNNILDIYNYLNARGFELVPRLIYNSNNSYITEYVDDIYVPDEQKISDLIITDALLHSKTVYYKEMSIDEGKEIYDKLLEKINSTYYYYDDIVTMIENKIYMSPSEYLLARNCSSIFYCLDYCKNELDRWYEIISKTNKKREVLLHNNLDVSHILNNNSKNILISWDHAKRDKPIYDLIRLYKNNYNKYDFVPLLKVYEKKFPLLEEERILLYIILFIPEKIIFSDNEFLNTVNVGKTCNYLYKTDRLFMENEAKDTEKQNNNIDE